MGWGEPRGVPDSPGELGGTGQCPICGSNRDSGSRYCLGTSSQPHRTLLWGGGRVWYVMTVHRGVHTMQRYFPEADQDED